MSANNKAGALNGPSLRYQAALEKCGAAAQDYDRFVAGQEIHGILLTGVKFKLPNDPMGEVFVVGTAVLEGEAAVVAFHSANSFPEAFVGFMTRLKGDKLKWRVDEFATREDD